jgi:hypothetical protein
MKLTRKNKSNIFIFVINWIGIPLIFIYLFCMVIYPWINGKGNWVYVQSVWYNWQALNVGMLAFISSIIAFNISRFNADKQRERNFIAAKAFLPDALSELTTYFKLSASLLKEAWERAKAKTSNLPMSTTLPELPVNYKKIFSNCIKYAEPDIAEYLAYMLMRLQVHNARIEDLFESLNHRGRTRIILSENVISYMFRLGELQALTGRTFEFARGLESFNGNALVWEDYQNAFSNLDIWAEEFDDLIGFTKRAIERENIKAEP